MSATSRYPPAWGREVQTLLPACSHFVLSGNVRDLYFGPPVGDPPEASLMELPALVHRVVADAGIRLVLSYEPTVGTSVLGAHGIDEAEIEALLGRPAAKCAGVGDLDGLGALIELLARAAESVALVIESASRLVRVPGEARDLADPEFAFFRRVDRACRMAVPRSSGEGRSIHSPIVWIVDSDRDLPSWFTFRNESLRSISVPMPDVDDRKRMAANLLPDLAGATGFGDKLSRPVEVLSQQTAGMGLLAIRNVVDVATDQALPPNRIDDAARLYRVGVVENPWQADFIADRLREEMSDLPPSPAGLGGRPADADDTAEAGRRKRLDERVIGQPEAVRQALDILARSATGLTAAQSGPTAARPRGVLFLAGPTGVGKTELAKAITTLLFDDDRAYVRFDMSEFSAEHSADRLIGAPPGYVGYDAGGELTNALRVRPFCVVLFDEIEKAHERILDKFLQVLDEGRLTDGRGETVYFTEAVIVFTSNLGIYQEVPDPDKGLGATKLALAISPKTHGTRAERAAAVRNAIREHFTLRLGRPELLNRIGEDNIVVFDFIDEPTALRILDGMLRNVERRYQKEHGAELRLTGPSLSLLRQAVLAPEVMAMGGRGTSSKVETVLVNPLARLLVRTPPGERAWSPIELTEAGGNWTARWT